MSLTPVPSLLSVALRLTVTSELFQLAPLGAGEVVAAVVGGEVSRTAPPQSGAPSVAGAVARSCWLLPSASITQISLPLLGLRGVVFHIPAATPTKLSFSVAADR